MIASLHQAGQFEDEKASKNREIVLGQLDKVVQEFVYKASLKHGFSESMAKECKGKIYTFGSYRLGVHNTGADIDTLCVVPAHVTRDYFFGIMASLLAARPDVKELTPVPEAYVPVIKMEFSGVPIDLTFASLNFPSIPADLELLDTKILRNLDEQCIRSINGSRVTDEILRLVPNIRAFRDALRCIKYWAKKRGVYSNSLGFLGGVAWAMLVARVCQLYPNAVAGAIIVRFFRIMYQWNWPQPVLLKPIEEGPLRAKVWNPKLYIQDRAHRMPIITPAYPSMCATHNVSKSTLVIMTSEFRRGIDVLDKILDGTGSWSDLFVDSDFFFRYKHYLQVQTSSIGLDSHHKLTGLVESRLRHLVMKLENIEHIVLCHPSIDSIDQVYECKSKEIASQISEGQMPNIPRSTSPISVQSLPYSQNSSTKGESSEPTVELNSTVFFIGLMIAKKPSGQIGNRKIDLSWPAQEFLIMIKQFESWDPEKMFINIKFFKNSELPLYVFKDGINRYNFVSAPSKASKQSLALDKSEKEPTSSPLVKKSKLLNISNNPESVSSPVSSIEPTIDLQPSIQEFTSQNNNLDSSVNFTSNNIGVNSLNNSISHQDTPIAASDISPLLIASQTNTISNGIPGIKIKAQSEKPELNGSQPDTSLSVIVNSVSNNTSNTLLTSIQSYELASQNKPSFMSKARIPGFPPRPPPGGIKLRLAGSQNQ
ncbi:hypothetical protein BB560_000259 [Smittium megazygosporum]|uniref:Poly(A) polymerase n=1 Tax=Smittium megazygosporum TaxID=133381 RepID=A0A2T9YFZ7_9FUNG|nr:hypothetical protein BB560_006137 [Smittium megazygosporum]PVV05220.1 hypothetical protein BB560_000259 [Smittium megazygosporum]